MDLDKAEVPPDEAAAAAAAAVACSICLELVLHRGGDRSTAKLRCGHDFHLDCIGSAFNAKGAMQCPNCRKVEKGRWLYSNGHRTAADFDIEGLLTDDIYELSYPDLPVGIQWCPFRGFTHITSLFEEGEPQPYSYHELVGSSVFGDHSIAASSTHVCPYLAVNGYPHAHAPSSATDSVLETAPFHRHQTSYAGQSNADLIRSHMFIATEPQNHSWQQQHSAHSLSGNMDQPASQFGMRLSRSDSSSQQRYGSFVHPHPILQGPVSRNGSNLVASLAVPVGDVRVHAHGPGNHIYQQSMPSMQSSPFSVRRMRPRRLALITAASSEIGGLYGFSVSGSVNRSNQDGENVGRHVDPFYGSGREALNPLPWLPVEGESQYWGPFNPNQNPQPGSFAQRAATDRAVQSRAENVYQRMPPPRMPPYM